MLKVKVLGFGCHRCHLVEQIAAEELAKVLKDTPDLIVSLEHIDDVFEIQMYHVFYTPGLIVNEKLVCAG